jgi:hypothetical protein
VSSTDDPDALNAALRGVDYLEESLLNAVEVTHYGYSAELRFAHLRRGRPVSETRQVTLVMEAVSALRLDGGLSEAMVEHPDRINWGLSEVARVSAYAAEPGVGRLVAWEGEREIRVEAARARFHASPG